MVVLTNSEMNQFSYQDWAVYFAKNKRLNIDFLGKHRCQRRINLWFFPLYGRFKRAKGLTAAI